jgi:hypothetical protein
MAVNPSTWTHTIALQLQIMPNNKILVPGLEPSSNLSSNTLGAFLAREGVKSALVDVKAALAAIPGSSVKYGANFNQGGFRQKWFVLPPFKPGCPCVSQIDYYKILKSLATEDLPEVEDYSACDINGMGYCPHPDFKLAEPPPVDPYQPEGSFPVEGGVLPPVPEWGFGDDAGIVK